MSLTKGIKQFSLLWNPDARPHEIKLLKIKHIRLMEKYCEGEIPQEAKTGTGPILDNVVPICS